MKVRATHSTPFKGPVQRNSHFLNAVLDKGHRIHTQLVIRNFTNDKWTLDYFGTQRAFKLKIS